MRGRESKTRSLELDSVHCCCKGCQDEMFDLFPNGFAPLKIASKELVINKVLADHSKNESLNCVTIHCNLEKGIIF